MFRLKLSKVNLNALPKTVIIGVFSCVSIEPVYGVFVDEVTVRCLKVYAVAKEDTLYKQYRSAGDLRTPQ